MGERRITPDGRILEMQADGSIVEVGGTQPQMPSDPTFGYKGPQAAANVQQTQAQAATAAAAAPYAGPQAAATLAKTQADAAAAAAQAAAAVKEQANAPDPGTAKIQKALQTDSVLEAINTARAQIGKGWATGNVAGSKAFQGVPFAGQNSANLAATLSGISGSIINDTITALKAASANGASGYGSLTETEAQRLSAAVGALQQTQDDESLKLNLARVERHYRNAQALLNNEDPRRPEVAEKYGIVGAVAGATGASGTGAGGSGGSSPPPSGGHGGAPRVPGGDAEYGNLTSKGTYQADPTLRGVNAHVKSMIAHGMTASDIRGYLNGIRPGLGAQAQHIEEAINYAHQNPGKAGGIQVDVEKAWKPADPVSEALGSALLTPAGTALVGSADMLSGGFADNLTSNPAETRALMSGLSQTNPGPYAGGQVGGGVLSGIAMEGLLARAGIAGPVVSDLASGALYGAGSADDPGRSRVAAALLGAGEGAIGGKLGRGTARVTGRALTGVTDAARVALNDAGVRMTPGQVLGGAVQRVEDRLSGLPFVGDAINARRREGVQDFNRAAFDEALGPIVANTGGVIGEPGVDLARQARSDAYRNALDPVTVQADAPFITDMQNTVQAGRALPEPMRSNMDYTLPTRVGQSFDPNGVMTGNGYQQSLRGLRRDANAVANQPYGYDFGQITNQAEAALEGMLQRQSPGVVEALRAANRANTGVETIRAAVNAARNGSRSHQPGVFMPSQLADAASQTAKRFGNSQGTTNQPFFTLSRAGQEVLPSQIPDSGTAGRLLLPLAVGSVAGGGGAATADGTATERGASGATIGTVAALLAAAPYSAGARATVQRLLLADRPLAMTRAGEVLLDRAGVAGRLAAPSTLVYLGGE